MALLVIGALAVIIALSLGKEILAPLALAIFAGLVFGPVADRLERFGMIILLALVVGLPLLGQALHMDLNLLSRLLLPPLNFLYNAVVTITGSGGTIDALGLNSDTP